MKINLQKTLLGRTLRRLAGEEKGAVMMEYVVLAALLVAGVVAAVIYFGRTTSEQLSGASTIMTGQVTKGEKILIDNQGKQEEYHNSAQQHQKAASGSDL